MRLALKLAAAALVVVLTSACAQVAVRRASAPVPAARELLAAGVASLREGDRERARTAFEGAVAHDPLYVEAHRRLQNVRLADFDAEALWRDYRALLAAHPDSAEACYLFGRIQYRIEDQIAWFEKAARLDPGFGWAHHALAWSHERLGEHELAEEELAKALAIDPTLAVAHYLAALVHIREKRNLAAEVSLVRSMQLDPVAIEPRVLHARLLAAEGRALQELERLDEILALEPMNVYALDRLEALAREGPESPATFLAADRLEGRLRLFPDDARLLARVARVDETRGRHEAAARRARAALDAGLEDPAALVAFRRFRTLPLAFVLAEWQDAMGISARWNPPVAGLERAIARFDGDGGPASALALLEALAGAGWIDEALVFADRFDGATPAWSEDLRSRWTESLARTRAHKRFLAELALFATKERERPGTASEDLASFVDRIAQRLEERTGIDVRRGNEVLGFALLGEMLDVTRPAPGGINAQLATFNQVLLAGRWAGQRPEVMLMTLSRPPLVRRPDGWPDAFGFLEIVGDNVLVAPPENHELGRALWRASYLNLDRIVASRIERMAVTELSEDVKRRLLASRGLEASGTAERTDVSQPLAASAALLLRAVEIHGTLPIEDHVRVHEEGHLIDAAERLPVLANPIPNLFLAMQAGFSTAALGGILEERAQLHALRHGPSPHLVLSEMIDFLPDGSETGIHHRGYATLLRRFLSVLDADLASYPDVDPGHRLVHQLHHLSEEEIRRIAAGVVH